MLAPVLTNTNPAFTETRPRLVLSPLSVILAAMAKFSASEAAAPVLPSKVADVASRLFVAPTIVM